jgi:hypothetical protein
MFVLCRTMRCALRRMRFHHGFRCTPAPKLAPMEVQSAPPSFLSFPWALFTLLLPILPEASTVSGDLCKRVHRRGLRLSKAGCAADVSVYDRAEGHGRLVPRECKTCTHGCPEEYR